MHQSANESFSNAHQLRTAADQHLQTGFSELKNFTNNDANDFRSGSGVSNTVTDSINHDLRTMKDAVHHYNKHHDLANHTSLEAAASYRLNSDKSLWGKGWQWVTATSFDVSGTFRAQGSQNNSVQSFNNSSEGQAFNKALNHMVNTAKTNHLDATDSHNLSTGEQIAANFSKGQSSLEQASGEYAHGQQLQKAESHAREQASAIDSNLSQAYHDWVVSKFGAEGERVMLQADYPSIAKQHQWANEFLQSGVGETAIASEVRSALSQTGSDLRHDYKTDAAQIKTKHNLQQQYQQDAHTVDQTSKKAGVITMGTEHLRSAQEIQADHRMHSVVDEASKTSGSVTQGLEATDKDIEAKHKHLNKEQ